ncbi:hypothetical protein ABZ383_07555 [Streptomyces sp. NPDC005900]|uniref:hypothetical protein n=1 Tax=Streptomyces sp. NPDC005900 TaxID=3154569 RepID=UPI00340281F9
MAEEARQLAQTLRELTEITGMSLERLHQALRDRGLRYDVSRSSLSGLINARTQRPKQAVIRAMYELAAESAKTSGSVLPMGWEELEALRIRVCARPARLCVECRKPVAGRGTGAVPALPVPASEGDRQYGADEWLPMPALLEHIHAGRTEDAAGILRFIGALSDAPEVALAVRACRAAGLCEEAEGVLYYAQMQRGREQLATLAYEFLLHGQHQDAQRVLAASLGVQVSVPVPAPGP